jgi:nitrogen regulatory protein PII
VFESRFLPKALLIFLVKDEIAAEVASVITDSARSGHESGDGIVWRTPVESVVHNRTGRRLEEVEVGA